MKPLESIGGQGGASGARSWRVAIIQTGRLGDLWMTTPLAHHYHAKGCGVEVWYDAQYGDPFRFFPYVEPRPVALPRLMGGSLPVANIVNWGWHQIALNLDARREGGRRIVWNQVFPFRLHAYLWNRPYPEFWYRKFPEVNFRRAPSTLPSGRDGSLLLFTASRTWRQRAGSGGRIDAWVDETAERLAGALGLRIVHMPAPDLPDHPRFENWRGSLDDFQRRIAACSVVCGISTSGHVLGQLLGKPVVILYPRRWSRVDTLGGETVKLVAGQRLSDGDIERVRAGIAESRLQVRELRT